MVNDNTSNMRSKAAPHPCSWADEYGWDASLQILKGNASTGELKPVKNKLVPKIVIINGAVSPAILDTAKTIPVVIPLLDPFTTICQTTFHLEIPRAYAASLNEFGISFNVSSETLATMGIMIMDKTKAPAIIENEPNVRTIVMYPTIPTTTEGIPVNTSINNLRK